VQQLIAAELEQELLANQEEKRASRTKRSAKIHRLVLEQVPPFTKGIKKGQSNFFQQFF
jgi:hypothetical protein